MNSLANSLAGFISRGGIGHSPPDTPKKAQAAFFPEAAADATLEAVDADLDADCADDTELPGCELASSSKHVPASHFPESWAAPELWSLQTPTAAHRGAAGDDGAVAAAAAPAPAVRRDPPRTQPRSLMQTLAAKTPAGPRDAESAAPVMPPPPPSEAPQSPAAPPPPPDELEETAPPPPPSPDSFDPFERGSAVMADEVDVEHLFSNASGFKHVSLSDLNAVGDLNAAVDDAPAAAKPRGKSLADMMKARQANLEERPAAHNSHNAQRLLEQQRLTDEALAERDEARGTAQAAQQRFRHLEESRDVLERALDVETARCAALEARGAQQDLELAKAWRQVSAAQAQVQSERSRSRLEHSRSGEAEAEASVSFRRAATLEGSLRDAEASLRAADDVVAKLRGELAVWRRDHAALDAALADATREAARLASALRRAQAHAVVAAAPTVLRLQNDAYQAAPPRSYAEEPDQAPRYQGAPPRPRGGYAEEPARYVGNGGYEHEAERAPRYEPSTQRQSMQRQLPHEAYDAPQPARPSFAYSQQLDEVVEQSQSRPPRSRASLGTPPPQPLRASLGASLGATLGSALGSALGGAQAPGTPGVTRRRRSLAEEMGQHTSGDRVPPDAARALEARAPERRDEASDARALQSLLQPTQASGRRSVGADYPGKGGRSKLPFATEVDAVGAMKVRLDRQRPFATEDDLEEVSWRIPLEKQLLTLNVERDLLAAERQRLPESSRTAAIRQRRGQLEDRLRVVDHESTQLRLQIRANAG